MTGILYHEDFINHNTGMGHPERPGRVTVITEELKKDTFSEKLVWDEPRLATIDEIAYAHSTRYIEHVKTVSAAGPQYIDSPDTLVSKHSYTAALRAAGALMTGIDGIIEGKYATAFCPVRPPGHHARYSMAMG